MVQELNTRGTVLRTEAGRRNCAKCADVRNSGFVFSGGRVAVYTRTFISLASFANWPVLITLPPYEPP